MYILKDNNNNQFYYNDNQLQLLIDRFKGDNLEEFINNLELRGYKLEHVFLE